MTKTLIYVVFKTQKKGVCGRHLHHIESFSVGVFNLDAVVMR